MACGIFLDQGLNLCLLHRQADSFPPRCQGSALAFFFFFFFFNIYLAALGLSCSTQDLQFLLSGAAVPVSSGSRTLLCSLHLQQKKVHALAHPLQPSLKQVVACWNTVRLDQHRKRSSTSFLPFRYHECISLMEPNHVKNQVPCQTNHTGSKDKTPRNVALYAN